MTPRLVIGIVPVFALLTIAIQRPSTAVAQAPGRTTIHERDVVVPMRDGVRLRADILRPSEGRFPTLVYRTPYGKRDALEEHTTFTRAVERGYAVVVQDVRGRYASDGEFRPYENEGRDGYDTIEWAARQPWSNGRVGDRSACRIRAPCSGSPPWKIRRTSRRWSRR